MNDTITVMGSRVTMEGEPVLIAAQIKRGEDVLKLRDENGVPAGQEMGGKSQSAQSPTAWAGRRLKTMKFVVGRKSQPRLREGE